LLTVSLVRRIVSLGGGAEAVAMQRSIGMATNSKKR
jgi:hypothetical protein